MQIFLLKDSKTLGPFSEGEVLEMIEQGLASESDLAHVDGLTDWIELRNLIVRAPVDLTVFEQVRRAFDTEICKSKRIWLSLTAAPLEGGFRYLIIGIVVLILSQWPLLLCLPFFALAIAGGIQILRVQHRHSGGIVLVGLASIILIFMILAGLWRSENPAQHTHRAMSNSLAPMPQQRLDSQRKQSSPQPVIEASPVPPIAVDTRPMHAESMVPPRDALPFPPPAPDGVLPQAPLARMGLVAPAALAPLPDVLPDAPPLLGPEEAVFSIETQKGKGTGFLAVDGGQTFFYTNYHVVEAAGQLKCVNTKKTIVIASGTIEIAMDRDLVRFPITQPGGLLMATDVSLGENVATYGDSGGRMIMTKLDGKLLGSGPKEVEVSCEFIPGNSGGPISNERGEVIAVATYVAQESAIPKWVASGTRFIGPRRFGVRPNTEVSWTRMSLRDFQEKSAEVARAEAMLGELVQMSRTLVFSPFQEDMKFSFRDEQKIANFATSYNNAREELQKNARRTYTRVEQERLARRYRGRIRQYGGDLGRAIGELATDLNNQTRDTREPYLRTRLGERIEAIEELSQFLSSSAKDTSASSIFRAF